MCGIFCDILFGLTRGSNLNFLPDYRLYKLLKNRGPNSTNIVHLQENILFGGFVLWHQGKSLTTQPVDSDLYYLLFNGDLFNISNSVGKSDISWIAEQLSFCENDDDILKLLKRVEGPYSIIFFNKNTKCLYFARDALGRNSLLIEKSEDY